MGILVSTDLHPGLQMWYSRARAPEHQHVALIINFSVPWAMQENYFDRNEDFDCSTINLLTSVQVPRFKRLVQRHDIQVREMLPNAHDSLSILNLLGGAPVVKP